MEEDGMVVPRIQCENSSPTTVHYVDGDPSVYGCANCGEIFIEP